MGDPAPTRELSRRRLEETLWSGPLSPVCILQSALTAVLCLRFETSSHVGLQGRRRMAGGRACPAACS